MKKVSKYEKGSRSYVMSRIGPVDTLPELKVRRFLFKSGYRYRLHDPNLPGRPDIVLSRFRIVIFVNGCFWHAHNCRDMKLLPKTNTEFWNIKFAKNKERDERKINQLKELGWKVIIVWECETSDERLSKLVDEIKKSSC